MKVVVFLLTLILISTLANGQDSLVQKGKYPSLQFSGALQIWLRYTETNPGSTANLQPVTNITDLSIRRIRLKLAGSLTPRLSYTIQLGENNINYLTGRDIRLRILDAYAEFQLNDALYLGAGKSAWTGLARGSTPATQRLLGLDLAVMATPTLNIEDDFLRTLGIFARGSTKKINYRFNVSNPFSNYTLPVGSIPVFSPRPGALQFSGYAAYNFVGEEKLTNAFYPGTYLGTKKIISLGSGFIYQADALQSVQDGVTIYHDMNHIAIDLFCELPHNTAAFTLYASWFNYNFGPGYLRSLGVNNIANGVNNPASYNGPGNSFPVLGTGNALLTQVGYLLPQKKQSEVRYQLYASLHHGAYNGMKENMNLLEGGVTAFLKGHQSKLTFGYQSRPIYQVNPNNELLVTDRKSMWVLMYQITLN